MNFEELKKYDSKIELVSGNPRLITGISSYLAPKENTFIFIKNKKVLDDIGRLGGVKEVGALFDENFYRTLEAELLSTFSWYGTTSDFSRSMCLLSKPFYDEMYENLNYHVDGRQMGSAKIDPDAEIAQNVFVGENVIIGKNTIIMSGAVILPEVHIADNSIIYPNVTVYPYTKIGNSCRIHSGTVIGADGFGYNFIDGVHEKIWHTGGVIIDNNVEIGSNSHIDSGCFIETRIGEGTKIDNDVQISHNAQIGKHCIFCGKSGVAGSVEVGDYVVFASGAGAAPGARIGAGSQVAAMAVISENAIIEPKSVLGGHPARPLKEWLKTQAKLRGLLKK